MTEKRIIGRAVQKHDVEKNWQKATGFIPMAGELIIYDRDDNIDDASLRGTYNYARFKIGDGIQNVNVLPFVDDELRIKLTEQINEINDKLNALDTLVGDTSVSEQITTALEDKADIDHTHDTLYVNLVTKLPSAVYWSSAVYGNGKFVAVASNTNQAAYSTDGISWTGTTLPLSDNWMSVTYGGNKFVAIASNSSNMAYSSDGVTWTIGTMPGDYTWNSIAYGNGCFIAISSGSATYAYSYGGTNWYSGSFPTTEYWSDIVFDGSNFIVTAEYTDVVLSGSHLNWRQISNNSGVYGLTRVASDGNQFSVALGAQFDGEVCWTDNGSTWNQVSVNIGMMTDIAYGNDKFVVVGSGEQALYSYDGKNWEQSTLPGSLGWNTVVYGDGKFVAIANSSVVSAISYDGISWVVSESSILDKNGNDVVPQVSELLSEWTPIYDSGEISSDVNAFSDINVSGYKHIMVAIKCVNTTKSTGGISGSIIFKGSDGRNYAFKNILPNLIKNTTGTSGGMAIFQIVNGFIVCENAMRAQSADNMLSDTEGYGADNLTPVGGGIVKCSNPVPTLMISNANLSTSYYYGVGSRVIVWGCRV